MCVVTLCYPKNRASLVIIVESTFLRRVAVIDVSMFKYCLRHSRRTAMEFSITVVALFFVHFRLSSLSLSISLFVLIDP